MQTLRCLLQTASVGSILRWRAKRFGCLLLTKQNHAAFPISEEEVTNRNIIKMGTFAIQTENTALGIQHYGRVESLQEVQKQV